MRIQSGASLVRLPAALVVIVLTAGAARSVTAEGGAPSAHGAAAAAPPAAVAAPNADPAATAEAKALFVNSCATCHGAHGAGDGLAAAGLPVRPRSFADAAWQRSASDAEIDRAIVGGGAAVGKSPLMPPNPELAAKPAVVAALRALVRGFGEAAPAAP